MPAFQYLGHCSEGLCSNVGDWDGAPSEQSAALKGAGICVLTPPPNSPGNLGKSPNFSAPECPRWQNGDNNLHRGALIK